MQNLKKPKLADRTGWWLPEAGVGMGKDYEGREEKKATALCHVTAGTPNLSRALLLGKVSHGPIHILPEEWSLLCKNGTEVFCLIPFYTVSIYFVFV